MTPNRGGRSPLAITTIVIVYWGLASAYIILSDVIVHRDSDQDAGHLLTNISKGLAFVLVTTIVLLLMLQRRQRVIVEATRREEALRDHLEEALRLEAVGRLAGGVAHDFNNLLMVMSGRVELLRDTVAEERLGDLNALSEVIERAVDKTRELQTVAKQQVLDIRLADLGDVVKGSHRMMEGMFDPSVLVEVEVASDPMPVNLDRHRFEQVLLNLATNAADAMPGGGRLRISAQAPDALHLQIIVADTGHGMTEEQRSHCFEPFYTTKADGRGTGLGLSLSYGIVAQSGGDIEVDSAPGKGTTFTITLPRAPSAP